MSGEGDASEYRRHARDLRYVVVDQPDALDAVLWLFKADESSSGIFTFYYAPSQARPAQHTQAIKQAEREGTGSTRLDLFPFPQTKTERPLRATVNDTLLVVHITAPPQRCHKPSPTG